MGSAGFPWQAFTMALSRYGCPHTRFAGQKNNLYNGKG